MHILVGLPGSGKSTYADYLSSTTGAVICSSDNIRKRLFGDESIQENNKLVFDTLFREVAGYLRNGTDVIYDATNVTIKSRRGIIKYVKDLHLDCKIHCVVIATKVETCIERNNKRDRKVPKSVIIKMLESFQLPLYGEGIDFLDIYYTEPNNKYDIDKIRNLMDGFDQKNPHHKFDLGTHCRKCSDILRNSGCDSNLVHAASIHDIGKLYTQTFDENGHAHYYGHENVGAYILLLSDKLSFETIKIVNYHMIPFTLKKAKDKTINRYKEIMGTDLWEEILAFNKADIISSGREEE